MFHEQVATTNDRSAESFRVVCWRNCEKAGGWVSRDERDDFEPFLIITNEKIAIYFEGRFLKMPESLEPFCELRKINFRLLSSGLSFIITNYIGNFEKS